MSRLRQPPKKPGCPRCGSDKSVAPIGLTGELYRCLKCGGMFDGEPDEVGDYSDRSPSARLERQERRRTHGR